MKKTHAFLIIVMIILLIIYYSYYCEGRMAEVVEPDLKIYALLQPIRNISDSDDMIVYSIDESYKYDSIDVSILEDMLKGRHINYLITKNNEILFLEDEVPVVSVVAIEAERYQKRNIDNR